MKRPIFYDTETTGTKPKTDAIIEIAAFDPERDKTFSTLINPQKPIPEEATRVHHITDDMVKDAPPFSEVDPNFVQFCEGDVVLIAHNNEGFDKHFLIHEFERNGLNLPPFTFFDTLLWARRYRPDLPRHTLQALREVYGIEANTAHRALDDVIILHKVYLALVDDLTIEQALEALSKPKTQHTMPFGKHKGTPLSTLPKSYISWLSQSGALDKPENADLKLTLEALHKRD